MLNRLLKKAMHLVPRFEQNYSEANHGDTRGNGKPCRAQASSKEKLRNSFHVYWGCYDQSLGQNVAWKTVHLREQSAIVNNGNLKGKSRK